MNKGKSEQILSSAFGPWEAAASAASGVEAAVHKMIKETYGSVDPVGLPSTIKANLDYARLSLRQAEKIMETAMIARHNIASWADMPESPLHRNAQASIESAERLTKEYTRLATDAIAQSRRSYANFQMASRLGKALGPGLNIFQLGHATFQNDAYKVGKAATSILAGVSSGAIAAAVMTAGFPAIVVALGSGLIASWAWGKMWDNGGADFWGVERGTPFWISDAVMEAFGGAQTWQPRRDPLILDLDGDGIETVGANGYQGILFDHTGAGIAQGSGWVARDDGLLVLDRDGNGTIDSGRELFGDSTELGSGERARDGFEALRELDDNQDGVVDAADAAYTELRVWRDLNQDGVSQEDELEALHELDIAALNTGSRETSDDLGNGNLLTDVGSYVRGDGTTQTMGDVDFASSPFYRRFESIVEISDRAAGLPDMRGSGMVRDLREAASVSASLAAALEAYAAASTRAEQHRLLDELLERWAATSEMPTFAQEALAYGSIVDYQFGGISIDLSAYPTGPIAVPEGSDSPNAVLDAVNAKQSSQYRRWIGRMAVLERFVGTTFAEFRPGEDSGKETFEFIVERPSGASQRQTFGRHTVELSVEQLALLEDSYTSLRNSVYESLLPQTRLRPYLQSIGLTLDGDRLAIDFTATEALFLERIGADATNGLIDLFEFNSGVGEELANYGWSGWELLTDRVATSGLGDEALAVLQEFAVLAVNPIQDVLRGSSKSEVLVGTEDADRLFGEAGDDRLIGGNGDDFLEGGWGHDTLRGGEGNDELHGFDGGDTYRFDRGHGQDIISEWWSETHSDVIEFGAGIRPDDLRVTRSGQDLVLASKDGRDRISVIGWYSDARRRIERVVFSDGSEWTADEIHARGLEMHGTAGNDQIRGANGDYADRLFGAAGDDNLAAGMGDDFLDGGSGDDVLFGDSGDDLLQGGPGADHLWGYSGSDTYAFDRGDGADTIHEYSLYGHSTDRVTFGEGTRALDLWFTRSDDDLLIRNVESNDTLTVEGWYRHSRHQVERFELAQGAVLLAGQVNQLVAAMAAYDPAPGYDSALPEPARAALEPLITASWQPAV